MKTRSGIDAMLSWSLTAIFLVMISSPLLAGERILIQLKDFRQTEVKSGGFILPTETQVHIYSIGGGVEKKIISSNAMYAYGWIINADTREQVWEMDRYNTSAVNPYRKFNDWITLSRGSYEVYFAAYGFAFGSSFSNFNWNIDRRQKDYGNPSNNTQGFLNWLEEIFGGDGEKDWKRLSKNWEISLSVDDRTQTIQTFSPPKEFPNIIYKQINLGENEHLRQRFHIDVPAKIRIYALGEKSNDGELADYGWIVNMKNHSRIWEMRTRNVRHAGGAEKNILFDGVVNFPAGDYILYYSSDGSHSYLDWNAPPPNDPFHYGITLIATDDKTNIDFKLMQTTIDEENVIVQLTKVRDDEMRSASFTLREQSSIRIYAIGERSNSRGEMADFGWIINARTRDKVWEMTESKTEPAGGASKNRMVDEIITLPHGTYTVFYQSNDSHSYDDWSSEAPSDPEHWGITIYGEGDNFSMKNVEKNVDAHEPGTIAQITRVGNNTNSTKYFELSKPTRVRIYALGEGQNNEMYDYGYIENANNSHIFWQMTYSMTFHAGGDRKNRSVNTTILLDKGKYILHYVSDDSHSFNHWNSDPPDDPTMWGITLYEEK